MVPWANMSQPPNGFSHFCINAYGCELLHFVSERSFLYFLAFFCADFIELAVAMTGALLFAHCGTVALPFSYIVV